MPAVQRDLYIEQGATFILHFQWCHQGPIEDGIVTPGTPYDLTDYEARMEIRKGQHEPVKVSATSTNGKIHLGAIPGDWDATLDPENGRIEVRLSDEDTDLLDVKSLKYDLELEDPNGVVYRLLQGGVTVDPNITQVEAEDPIVGDG